MKSPFASAARVALEEIVMKHANPSKYGHFLSSADLKELVDELLKFVETSRNLRVVGDNFLKKGLTPEAGRGGPRRPER